jgi:hypothetical protein
MGNERIRVYALAQELGLLPQAVLDAARRLGCAADNQLSVLGPQERADVERALGRRPPEDPTGVTSKLRPKGPGPEAALADFDAELARTRQNAELMALLDERARQTQTVPLDEVKRQLGLNESDGR